MSDRPIQSLFPVAGAGGFAIVTGVVCCLGLKMIGAAVMFGGLATTLGITTDQATFVIGGLGGLVFAVGLFGYRRLQRSGRIG